jgi:hypothetical protein
MQFKPPLRGVKVKQYSYTCNANNNTTDIRCKK